MNNNSYYNSKIVEYPHEIQIAKGSKYDPRPETINTNLVGNFCRIPFTGIAIWMFTSKDNLKKFTDLTKNPA